MGEREARKETIQKGDLFFLSHPGTEFIFSGYGLIVQEGQKEELVGLLMVDRPRPADPGWLSRIKEAFGEYQLAPMTTTGERGIVCRMIIEPESQPLLQRFPAEKSVAIQQALKPMLEAPHVPTFILGWDQETHCWKSQIASGPELPAEVRQVFENFGHGCLAVETNIGVVHVCHASDTDIEGFRDKPVLTQWQLVKMPTAPLIRLEFTIFDRPDNPYLFESFLNIADRDQANILGRLASQDTLYLAFYDDRFKYRFTKAIPHDRQNWQKIDELVAEAQAYEAQIPPELRDFDRAKSEFLKYSF